MNNNRFARIFAIAKVKAVTEEQLKEMVFSVTNGKTSLKELTDMEISLVVRTLNTGQKNGGDLMRKKVISILASMCSYEANGYTYEFVDPTSNMVKMGSNGILVFVRRVGYLKKELNDYSVAELPHLVTQMEQFRKKTWEHQANKAVNELKSEIA